MTYTESECVDSIQRAADVLGKSPTVPEYNDLGFSPSVNTISRLLGSWNKAKKTAGLDLADTGTRKEINPNYFDSLTTESAYWLGFLYGDGSVQRREGGTLRLRLCVAEEDEAHLRKFRNALGSTHSVTRQEDERDGCQSTVRVNIQNDHLTSRLVELGLTPDKTFGDSLPDLDTEHRRHFVRGLFDADGHVGDSLYVVATSVSPERLSRIRRWTPGESYIQETTTSYQLRTPASGAGSLFDWLYPVGHKTEPALRRKAKVANRV